MKRDMPSDVDDDLVLAGEYPAISDDMTEQLRRFCFGDATDTDEGVTP